MAKPAVSITQVHPIKVVFRLQLRCLDKEWQGITVTAQILQKILDPREWLQATGLMDDTVRRLTESPSGKG